MTRPNEDPRKRDMIGKYYIALFCNGKPLMVGPLSGDTITTRTQAREIAFDTRGIRPFKLEAA